MSNIDINQVSSKEYQDNEFLSFINLIKRNKEIIFFISGLSFIFSIVFALMSERIWEGQIQIVLTEENLFKEEARDISSINSFLNIGSRNNGLKTKVEILKSPSVLMPIFEYVKQKNTLLTGKEFNQRFLDWRKNNFKLELVRGTNVLNISYQDKNKDLILNVLEKVSLAFQSYATSDRDKNITDGIIYLDEQIKKYEEISRNSYKKAIDYGIANKIINSSDLGFVSQAETSRIGNENRITKIRQILSRIDEIDGESIQIKYIAQTVVDNIGEEKLMPKIININLIEDTLKKNRQKYTANDPQILRNETSLKLALKLLKDEIKSTLSEKLDNNLMFQKSSSRPKDVIFKYKKLLRNSDREEATLNKILNEKIILELENAKQSKPWKLITYPTLLADPVAPERKKIVLIGIIIGFLGGTFLSFCRERIEDISFERQTPSRVLDLPTLFELNQNDFSSWEEILYLYARKIYNKKTTKEGLNIITLGNIDENNLTYIFEKLKSQLNEKEYTISINTKELNNNIDQIILVEVGSYKIHELKLLKDKLNISNNITEGILLLNTNNKNDFKLADFYRSIRDFIKVKFKNTN